MKRLLIAVSVLVLIFSLASVPAEAKTLADIIKAGKIVIGVKADYPPWSAINEKSEFEGWGTVLSRAPAAYLFGDPKKLSSWRLPQKFEPSC